MDSTIFFEKCNMENAKSLMCILKCLEEVTRLKVNYNKSKICCIGVNEIWRIWRDEWSVASGNFVYIFGVANWLEHEVGKFLGTRGG